MYKQELRVTRISTELIRVGACVLHGPGVMGTHLSRKYDVVLKGWGEL